MANGTGDSITPYLAIWTAPRATIRRIVDTDPRRNVIALAAIGPAISTLATQWSAALGNNANLSVLWPLWVPVYVALSAAFGVISLYIGGAIWRWSGSLLSGVASSVEVRAAMAWSQLPGIAAAIVLLIAVLLGVQIPHPTPGTLTQIDPAFYKIVIIEAVFGIWGLVLTLKCIGEVHRFSAWRALAAILIPSLIAVAALASFFFLVSRLAGHH